MLKNKKNIIKMTKYATASVLSIICSTQLCSSTSELDVNMTVYAASKNQEYISLTTEIENIIDNSVELIVANETKATTVPELDTAYIPIEKEPALSIIECEQAYVETPIIDKNEGYYVLINNKNIYVNPILNPKWDNSHHITPKGGVHQGPSGKETYYNLPMGGVVKIMRQAGFDEENWPYWEREDGCKMLGDYIMVAADLSIRPRGSLVETSIGTGIVCDTGDFIHSNPTQLDIAVTWE